MQQKATWSALAVETENNKVLLRLNMPLLAETAGFGRVALLCHHWINVFPPDILLWNEYLRRIEFKKSFAELLES